MDTNTFTLSSFYHYRYGDDCYEMINVTYIGDTLIAYKITGHSTVPSGEISFQANLSPFCLHQQEELEPIELGDAAAQQWECKYLPRFSGTVKWHHPVYTNRQFVQGQLIMVKDYFSFAWIPLGHQVFFGRPSAELALKMMQEAYSSIAENELICNDAWKKQSCYKKKHKRKTKNTFIPPIKLIITIKKDVLNKEENYE